MSITNKKLESLLSTHHVVLAEIKSLKLWISKSITREQMLVSEGHYELVNKIDELLTTSTQDIIRILTEHRALGLAHWDQCGRITINLTAPMPETPFGRCLMLAYISGLRAGAKTELQRYESELATREPLHVGDMLRTTEPPTPKPKAARKSADGPTLTSGDEEPLPKAQRETDLPIHGHTTDPD